MFSTAMRLFTSLLMLWATPGYCRRDRWVSQGHRARPWHAAPQPCPTHLHTLGKSQLRPRDAAVTPGPSQPGSLLSPTPAPETPPTRAHASSSGPKQTITVPCPHPNRACCKAAPPTATHMANTSQSPVLPRCGARNDTGPRPALHSPHGDKHAHWAPTWIFMATSRPPFMRARCTCPMEAAAKGRSSKYSSLSRQLGPRSLLRVF